MKTRAEMKPEVAEPDHDSALANEPVVTLEHT